MALATDYGLSVGEAAYDRLAMINQVYGPTSRRLLRNAGLEAGNSVVELGCGSGNMTAWISDQVGAQGRVVGIDASRAQLDRARDRCQGYTNVSLLERPADQTGLPRGSFDLVYMRLLLMHLREPLSVLRHARDLLRPGGVLVCEEAAVDTTFCDPPVAEQTRLHELAAQMASERGCDYNLGRRLGTLVQLAGFVGLDVSAHQPVYVSGPLKHLEVDSFEEAAGRWKGPPLVDLERVCQRMRSAAADDTSVYGLSMMMQVQARTTV